MVGAGPRARESRVEHVIEYFAARRDRGSLADEPVRDGSCELSRWSKASGGACQSQSPRLAAVLLVNVSESAEPL